MALSAEAELRETEKDASERLRFRASSTTILRLRLLVGLLVGPLVGVRRVTGGSLSGPCVPQRLGGRGVHPCDHYCLIMESGYFSSQASGPPNPARPVDRSPRPKRSRTAGVGGGGWGGGRNNGHSALRITFPNFLAPLGIHPTNR